MIIIVAQAALAAYKLAEHDVPERIAAPTGGVTALDSFSLVPARLLDVVRERARPEGALARGDRPLLVLLLLLLDGLARSSHGLRQPTHHLLQLPSSASSHSRKIPLRSPYPLFLSSNTTSPKPQPRLRPNIIRPQPDISSISAPNSFSKVVPQQCSTVS